ncbi:MAG TPA: hypothetical protein VMW00_06380 [Dehalococcoidales bacterium]|nr:hypothetical protein [Dehalococcoidales bacterium]
MTEIRRELLEEKTPVPTEEAKGSKQQPKGPPTAMDRVKEAYVQAEELKMFKDTVGDKGKGGGEGKSEGGEKGMSPEIAEIMIKTVSAYSDAMANLVTKVMDVQGGRQGDQGDNAFMKYLVDEIKGMKTKLDAGQGDPLELVDQVQQKMEVWQDRMRQRLGIPDAITGSGAGGIEGMKLMLELERIRDERDERGHQFDLNLQLLQRQWAIEDKRWTLDYNVKIGEVNQANKSRESAVNALKDLSASVIEAMENAPPEESIAERRYKPRGNANPPAEPPPMPTKITCPGCRIVFDVPPGTAPTDTIKCPECETPIEFDLKDM